MKFCQILKSWEVWVLVLIELKTSGNVYNKLDLMIWATMDTNTLRTIKDCILTLSLPGWIEPYLLPLGSISSQTHPSSTSNALTMITTPWNSCLMVDLFPSNGIMASILNPCGFGTTIVPSSSPTNGTPIAICFPPLDNRRIGLINWSRENFGGSKGQIKKIWQRLGDLQKATVSEDTKIGEKALKLDLEELWKGKIPCGNKELKCNGLKKVSVTRFFHSCVSQRLDKNEIMS